MDTFLSILANFGAALLAIILFVGVEWMLEGASFSLKEKYRGIAVIAFISLLVTLSFALFGFDGKPAVVVSFIIGGGAKWLRRHIIALNEKQNR